VYEKLPLCRGNLRRHHRTEREALRQCRPHTPDGHAAATRDAQRIAIRRAHDAVGRAFADVMVRWSEVALNVYGCCIGNVRSESFVVVSEPVQPQKESRIRRRVSCTPVRRERITGEIDRRIP